MKDAIFYIAFFIIASMLFGVGFGAGFNFGRRTLRDDILNGRARVVAVETNTVKTVTGKIVENK